MVRIVVHNFIVKSFFSVSRLYPWLCRFQDCKLDHGRDNLLWHGANTDGGGDGIVGFVVMAMVTMVTCRCHIAEFDGDSGQGAGSVLRNATQPNAGETPS